MSDEKTAHQVPGTSEVPGTWWASVLTLAGWRVRLECRQPELAQLVADRYAAFHSYDRAPADFTVSLALDDDATDARVETPAMHWQIQGDAWLLTGDGLAGYAHLTRGDAAIAFHGIDITSHLEHVLRNLVAIFADHRGGLLLHAAGLLVEGQAYLFMGPSGSGKSTVTQLSPHALPLNDDLVLLRQHEGRWMAFGTPFWNIAAEDRSGETACGPAAGIYRLVQDSKNSVQPLSPAAAAAELVASCPVVNAMAARLPALLARCQQIATAAPVKRLHFQKDASFWDVITYRSYAVGSSSRSLRGA
jgi:hypothetical protein